MSKRVYELARELDLSTKEVMGRLNDAGVEVKSHFAVVEDPVYERVFGEGSDGAAPSARSEVQQAEASPSMIQSPRERLPMRRVLAYILAAALALAVAAGVGAMAALMMRGDPGLPASEKPRPSEEQPNAQQGEKRGNAQHSEADYVSEVGRIQQRSVETFLDSHDKLLRYDALTADDVEQMQANQAALKELADQVDGLDPPQKYGEQYEAFRSASNELQETAQLAYTLAADPTAATQSGFEEYDRRVNEAAARLERSNEILGRNYKTIEGVQRVSPL
jgi:Translation initiation factor IF-2, N-terminal region